MVQAQRPQRQQRGWPAAGLGGQRTGLKGRRCRAKSLRVASRSQNGSADTLSGRPTLEQPSVWGNGAQAPDWDSAFVPPQQLYHRSKSVPLIPNRLCVFSGTSNSVGHTSHSGHQTSPHFVIRRSLPSAFFALECSLSGHQSLHLIMIMIFVHVQALAAEVACYLGLDLSPIKIKRFADGEIYVALEVHPA